MSRFILIMVAIIVVIGVALAATGALHFRNTADESSVTLDKRELNQKAHEAIEKTREAGGEVLDKTGQALHNAGQGLRKASQDTNATTTKPAADPKNTHSSQHGNDLPEDEGH